MTTSRTPHRTAIHWLAALCIASVVTLGIGAPGRRAEATAPRGEAPTCSVHGDKVARPATIQLGEPVQVELSIVFDCPQPPPPLDVVLVTDRSASMTGKPLQAARDAARALLAELQAASDRAALVSFGEDVTLDADFSEPLGRVSQALGWLVADGRTNLAGGFQAAGEVLLAQGRREAKKVAIVLTDGVDTVGSDPVPAADRLRTAGIQTWVIGLGQVNETVLRRLASSPAEYRYAPTPADLAATYREIAGAVTRPVPGDLVIDDTLGDDMAYLAGSALPSATVTGRHLIWRAAERPTSTWRLTYLLRPTRTGHLPTNQVAVANYTDINGAPAQFIFPVPWVDVLAPTSTPPPTLTATPPPVATAVLRPCFLPLVSSHRCSPADKPMDMVLNLDVSGSMWGQPLEDAKAAALQLVDELVAAGSTLRVGLVTHGDPSRVEVPVTRDLERVRRVIRAVEAAGEDNLPQAMALSGALVGRDAGQVRTLVILSDGGQTYPPPDAIPPARLAAADGIVVATVCFDSGAADCATMRAMASSPRLYFETKDTGELASIFHEIARVVVCD